MKHAQWCPRSGVGKYVPVPAGRYLIEELECPACERVAYPVAGHTARAELTHTDSCPPARAVEILRRPSGSLVVTTYRCLNCDAETHEVRERMNLALLAAWACVAFLVVLAILGFTGIAGAHEGGGPDPCIEGEPNPEWLAVNPGFIPECGQGAVVCMALGCPVIVSPDELLGDTHVDHTWIEPVVAEPVRAVPRLTG